MLVGDSYESNNKGDQMNRIRLRHGTNVKLKANILVENAEGMGPLRADRLHWRQKYFLGKQGAVKKL
jgi:hypothetical protein